jgi:hypothetical protein
VNGVCGLLVSEMWESAPVGEQWEYRWDVHGVRGVDGCVFGDDGVMYTWRRGAWLPSTRSGLPQWDELDRRCLALMGAERRDAQ